MPILAGGPRIFQKSGSHLQILGARRATYICTRKELADVQCSVSRTVTQRTFLGARELMHIFVGQERNVTNQAANIRSRRTKFILVGDHVLGMSTSLLLGVVYIPSFPPVTSLVLIPQYPLQFHFLPVPSQLLLYVYCLISTRPKRSQEFHLKRF